MPDTQSSDRQSDTEHDADDPYGLHPDSIKEPPTDLKGRLLFLGPGLVLVGSVVGSGEIILTTTLGSIVGFSMFWFVLLSCWSKTIIQAELGRYTVSSGEPFLHAFNRLPGKVPGFNGKKVSWYIYFWILWIIPDLLVGGGIYGGAGQAITEAFPSLGSEWWTVGIAFVAMAIALSGTYSFLEKFLTVMVVTFTFITVACAILLQMTEYAITWDEMIAGMGFGFPEMAIISALAMYGGTGVGTGEQIAYSYWCVEKGYARFTGPADESDDWVRRARGWIAVMQTDVKLTLILLTCATIPFYMLGAGVLHRLGEKPDGLETISVLSNMYTTTLGEWAFWLFLVGAFFVLFSTAISGLGANVRVFADGMVVLGLIKRNDYQARLKILRVWAVFAPIATAGAYFYFLNPVWMLTVGQLLKAIKFPIIAGGVIYLRYRHLDQRIAPSWKSDALLWLCFAFMIGLAIYILWVKFIA
jgi:Mn2+/Fe2+ NRAMP family transporter